ncbi:hypothetical protein ANACAC_01314 [Anaerostipes caccae L1-92]|uniref:Uncharacterized protein n=1 Tax=Anaerostipes caccae (strain DSM 14662 / CCUG 47493 / JCM 13470 / NCIMB 13811 / L1-92) TaxID=411490 RepID=B0MCM2_ANACD|nr:hypothetical protein ANACAC_01314 [Anaerostipes caccae L1-92]
MFRGFSRYTSQTCMKRIKPKDILRAALDRFAMIIKKNYKRRRY